MATPKGCQIGMRPLIGTSNVLKPTDLAVCCTRSTPPTSENFGLAKDARQSDLAECAHLLGPKFSVLWNSCGLSDHIGD